MVGAQAWDQGLFTLQAKTIKRTTRPANASTRNLTLDFIHLPLYHFLILLAYINMGRVDDAADAVRVGDFKNASDAASHHGCAASTVRHRLLGRPSRQEHHQTNSNLSIRQEEVLTA